MSEKNASIDVYLTFNGDCREAIKFYAAVFKLDVPHSMSYGESPTGASPAEKDRILYACMPVFGMNMMFCDCPADSDFVRGNNVMLTISLRDEAELARLFQEFSQGGDVYMPLEKTFFSDLFGMVCDRFGIIWQFSKMAGSSSS